MSNEITRKSIEPGHMRTGKFAPVRSYDDEFGRQDPHSPPKVKFSGVDLLMLPASIRATKLAEAASGNQRPFDLPLNNPDRHALAASFRREGGKSRAEARKLAGLEPLSPAQKLQKKTAARRLEAKRAKELQESRELAIEFFAQVTQALPAAIEATNPDTMALTSGEDDRVAVGNFPEAHKAINVTPGHKPRTNYPRAVKLLGAAATVLTLATACAPDISVNSSASVAGDPPLTRQTTETRLGEQENEETEKKAQVLRIDYTNETDMEVLDILGVYTTDTLRSVSEVDPDKVAKVVSPEGDTEFYFAYLPIEGLPEGTNPDTHRLVFAVLAPDGKNILLGEAMYQRDSEGNVHAHGNNLAAGLMWPAEGGSIVATSSNGTQFPLPLEGQPLSGLPSEQPAVVVDAADIVEDFPTPSTTGLVVPTPTEEPIPRSIGSAPLEANSTDTEPVTSDLSISVIDFTNAIDLEELGSQLRSHYENREQNRDNRLRTVELMVSESVMRYFRESNVDYTEFFDRHIEYLNDLLSGHDIDLELSISDVVVVSDDIATQVKSDNSTKLSEQIDRIDHLRWISEPGYHPDLSKLDPSLIHELGHYMANIWDGYYADLFEEIFESDAIGADGVKIEKELMYKKCSATDIECNVGELPFLSEATAAMIKRMDELGIRTWPEAYEWYSTRAYNEIGDVSMNFPSGSVVRMFKGRPIGNTDWNVKFFFEEHPDLVATVDVDGNLVVPASMAGGYSMFVDKGGKQFGFPNRVFFEIINPDGSVTYDSFSSHDFLGYWLMQRQNDPGSSSLTSN